MENNKKLNLFSISIISSIVVICAFLTIWSLDIISIGSSNDSLVNQSADVNEKNYNNLITTDKRYKTNPDNDSFGRTNPFENYK